MSKITGIAEIIQQAQSASSPELIIDAVPYARLLGMRSVYEPDDEGGALIFHLPPKKSNVGNPTLPALHGGAIGGFMEMAATIHVLMSMDVVKVPRVVDFSIDYVRAGRYEDTWASCSVVRQGNKLVNVAIQTWQQDRDASIATARAHFLIE